MIEYVRLFFKVKKSLMLFITSSVFVEILVQNSFFSSPFFKKFLSVASSVPHTVFLLTMKQFLGYLKEVRGFVSEAVENIWRFN